MTKYRQYILLTDLDTYDEHDGGGLPSESKIIKEWFLARTDTVDIGEHFDYFGKTLSDLQKDSLKYTGYVLYKDFALQSEDLNKFSYSTEIKEIEFEAAWVCIAMRLIRPSSFKAHRLLVRVEPSKIVPVQATAIGDNYFGVPGFKPIEALYTNSDIKKICKFSKYLIDLARSNERKHNRLLNSVDIFNETYKQGRFDTRFMLLMMAVESLFNYQKSEVAEQIAMGMSLFLEKEPNERLELYNKLKKAYIARSCLAHGNKQDLKKLNFYDISVQKSIYRVMHESLMCSIEKIISNDLEKVFNNQELLMTEMRYLRFNMSSKLI